MMNLQNKVVSHIDLYTDLGTGGRPAFIYAKQYDAKSRYIIATIKNGDQKIEVKGIAQFNVKKPDGTFFYADGQINDDSTVTVELDSQILAVDGEVSCDISIFDGDIPDRAILTTSTFFIIVEKSNYDLDAIKSSNIYVDLDDAKDKAQKAAEQAEVSSSIASDAAKAAEEAADRAELAGGGINTEVDKRLKALEKWMDDEVNYEPIKFKSFNMNPSTTNYEYGDAVASVKLTWELSRPAKSITVNGVGIDKTATEYEVTGPFTTDQSWNVVATDEKGATASDTKSITFHYEPIEIKSFTMEPSNTQYEYNTEPVTVKFKWQLNRDATKITLNGNDIDKDATEYELEVSRTNDTLVTLIVTGAKGETATKTKSITVTYENIKFKSFTMEPSDTKYEHGVPVDSVKLKWQLNRAATKITVNKAEINSTATEYEATGPFTTDQSWEVIVTGAKGETARRTASIDFYYYRVYWGLGTQEKEFDSNFVKSLGSSELTTTKEKKLTFSSADDQYVYYVIPTALGTPTFQIGEFAIESGFEPGVKIPVDTGFTDTEGNPITLDYNLYRSSNLLTNDESFNVYAK